MQKTADEILKELNILVQQWNADADFELEQTGANVQYGLALQQCSEDLMTFIKANISNITYLKIDKN